MKTLLAALAVAGLAVLGSAAPVSAAPPANQLCPALSSGKIDVSGVKKSVTIVAPKGMVITKVCVKAGSAVQGLGTKLTSYDPGVAKVTVSHFSGKGISHYSYALAPKDSYNPYS
ncbi:hypothetical protein NCCP1664_24820 [Zafaria cholistanensis]|uniref:Uncharacterized protein n=1 Tax=Zafaria cholistanensis TaxID=1682741 RepID=A0A5A7NV72_9MICC|nr:hypothetical protein [Zafaria cholistanensis]GER23987.1 hypothetical protein NCCP1664_24820 [Zafaria cholistanensis]